MNHSLSATPRRRRSLVGLAVLVCAALLAAACGDDDDASTNTTAADEGGSDSTEMPSGDLKPLRLALAHTVLFDTTAFDAVAEAKGYYAEEGIEITAREYPAGSGDIIQALVSDSVDLSVAVGTFAVYAGLAQGAPLSIVSGEWNGNSDLIYYVAADSDIESLDDVGGRTVAISRPGSTTDLVCREMQSERDADGDKPNECVTIGSPPDIFTAVTTGQVDVGWTTPPFFFDKLEDGTIRQIGTGDDLERLADITTRVGVARSDLVEDRPDVVEAFFRAYERAIDFTYENPEEAAKIWAEATDQDTPIELLVAAIKAYDRDNLVLDELTGLDVSLEAAEALEFLEDGQLTEEQVRDAVVIDQFFGDG